jgi:hypothetical protein
MYRLKIQGRPLVTLAIEGIADAATSNSVGELVPGVSGEIHVWVPLPIVHRALPHLVKKGDEGAAPEVSGSTF